MRGEKSKPVTFGPGTYYIGDPCYVIPDLDWMDYLNTWPKYPSPDPGYGWVDGIAVTYKGHQCWHSATAYGDGMFFDNEGHEYGVDAGIIGIVPIELCRKRQDLQLHGLGRIVKFKAPFKVYCDEDSTFHFGKIVIVTDEEEDDEE